MHKFSIIIPVYNVAPYLRECLDSVLAQTFTDWEAICVDDGSTDGSGAILDEYAVKDPRFRVVHKPNRGVSAARNTALDLAHGEWIAFLDGDDIWHPEFLLGTVKAMEEFLDCNLFRQGVVLYRDGDTCEFGLDRAAFCVKVLSREIEFDDFGNHYFGEHVYRRDIIGSVRFPPYRRGEDRVFFDTILLGRCEKMAVSEVPRYGYRIRSGSAMNSIPSVRVLMDELNHRRDLVLMIEASGKRVEYAGSFRLEGYFTKEVGRLIMQKAPRERVELWDAWIACVDEMRLAKGLSRSTRRIYDLCCRFRYRWFWWVLCRAWPWYDSHGIVPRGMRKMLRICKRKGRVK